MLPRYQNVVSKIESVYAIAVLLKLAAMAEKAFRQKFTVQFLVLLHSVYSSMYIYDKAPVIGILEL